MRLLELFDRVVEWDWVEGEKGPVARFMVGDKKYDVEFTTKYMEPTEGNIEKEVGIVEPTNGPRELIDVLREGHRFVMVQFQLVGNVHSMGMTGTRDEVVVMSTVMGILKEFVAKNAVTLVAFISNKREISRVKLYTRLANKFGKRVFHWEFALFTFFFVEV